MLANLIPAQPKFKTFATFKFLKISTMKKFFLVLVIVLVTSSFSQLTAQKNWKYINTIEDLYQSYPDRVKYMFEQIDLNHKGLEEVKKNHGQGNWVAACNELLKYYKNGNGALHLRKKQPLKSNEVVQTADTLLNNIFEIQNVKGKMPILQDGHRDWNYKGPNDDNEWAWLSNRHSQLYQVFTAYRQTGNPKYAHYADKFLRDFIIKSWPYPNNKSSTSVWRGLEVSFRSKIWGEIFYASLQNEYFQPVTHLLILISLPEHAHYNRHFHSKKGNWLTMEISALATVAAYFPEYKLSNQWLDYSIGEMNASMKEQIYPDGVQTELSSHYHNVSLRNFQLFYDICQKVGKKLPPEYEQTLMAMYNYTANIMRPDGSRILNNDSDRGNKQDNNRNIILDALKKFEKPEWEYIATNEKAGKKPLKRSYIYPWAGQLISRSGYDEKAHWSFFDIGPWGTGHQHQDKLHLSITAFGADFLVDAGRFAYRGMVAEKFRPYARGSTSHNLVLIDDKDQNPGPLKANSALEKKHYKINAAYDYAFGSFDDFKDLKGTAKHTRAFFYLKNEFWLVADRIETNRPRNLKFLWHWHPQCKIERQSDRITGIHEKGRLTLIPVSKQNFEISEIKGQEKPKIQGWYSPEYNLYEPNTLTQFSTNINKDQSFLWLVIPESQNSNSIETTLLNETSSHYSLELSVNGQKWKVTLPFEDSFKVELKKIKTLDL